MTELTVTEYSDLAFKPSFHAIATSGAEMVQAKAGIQNWLKNKLIALAEERKEIQESFDSAHKHKWKTSSFKTMLSRIGQKELYYGKLLTASEAGFVIVPNMDVTVFAIRTNRSWPKWNGNSGTSPHGYLSASPSVPDEEEQRLPVGQGHYESPRQVFVEHKDKVTKDGKELYRVVQECKGFDQIEFPLAVAHPIVMDAVSKAMAMKIFDRIGIVPRSQRLRGDPIVLGQITRKEGYSTKTASFLIAWYVDARTL